MDLVWLTACAACFALGWQVKTRVVIARLRRTWVATLEKEAAAP